MSLPPEGIPCIEVRMEKSVIGNKPGKRFGYCIGGGIDQNAELNPYIRGDNGVFVTNLIDRGPAHQAGLRIGDKVLEVNGFDLTMATHDHALSLLNKREFAVLKVTRKELLQQAGLL